MGVCWGAPQNPTPSFKGYVKPGFELTISSSSCSAATPNYRGSADTAGSNGIQDFPDVLLPQSLKVFTFDELKKATRGFHRNWMLKGWNSQVSQVFRGLLVEKQQEPSGSCRNTIVAVKKMVEFAERAHEKWLAEINFLGSLHHPNIANLIGFCCEPNERLLVYDFAVKGSLHNHLFYTDSINSPLPWDIRLKIVIGAARGLEFLHTSEKKIIYRDFRTSNILLDESYNAKLSDFGLALYAAACGDSETDAATGGVLRSLGYVAPECITIGHLSVKSDVYGFGVVLLEMLTGLVSHDCQRPKEQQRLVIWAKPRILSNRKVKDMIDPKANYPMNVALKMAKLISKCIRNDPRHRPSMSEVVRALEKIEAASMKLMPTSYDVGVSKLPGWTRNR